MQQVLSAPNSSLGWMSLHFSPCTHGLQKYPGLKGWEKDRGTNLSKNHAYSSDVFTLIERKTSHAYFFSLPQVDHCVPENLQISPIATKRRGNPVNL